jgi:hypothetical protein
VRHRADLSVRSGCCRCGISGPQCIYGRLLEDFASPWLWYDIQYRVSQPHPIAFAGVCTHSFVGMREEQPLLVLVDPGCVTIKLRKRQPLDGRRRQSAR